MDDKTKFYQAKLKEPEFLKISKFIEENFGIKLPPTKLIMVQNRLYKRLIATGIYSFEEYVSFIFSLKGKSELDNMVDVITTNKTEFFREKEHFQYLQDNIFNLNKNKTFKIWSAGCATGEEVYSLAIIAEIANVKYSIIGNDISNQALQIAKKGLYNSNKLNNVSKNIILKYFDKVLLDNKEYFKVKDSIKVNVNFIKLNLKKDLDNFSEDFDIIFLRNVLIYFNMKTQNEILKKVINHLKPEGYLFIGLSEAIYDRQLKIKRVGPSIYQKKY